MLTRPISIAFSRNKYIRLDEVRQVMTVRMRTLNIARSIIQDLFPSLEALIQASFFCIHVILLRDCMIIVPILAVITPYVSGMHHHYCVTYLNISKSYDKSSILWLVTTVSLLSIGMLLCYHLPATSKTLHV